MLLRRRPALTAPTALARVRALLGERPAGGWVPPPFDLPPADGAAVGDAEPSERDEPEEHSWHSDASDEPAAEPGERRAAPAGTAARAAAVPSGGAGPRHRTWLPAALTGARINPGPRGALALLLVVAMAVAGTAVVVLRGRPQEVAAPPVETAGIPLPGVTPASSASAGPEVVVAVAGSVARPGLVRLPAGSRVDDAVRAAGGLTPGASYGLLNLARRLVDGELVQVGGEGAPGSPASPGGASAGGGKVNLNAATVAELDALPGVGPVLAQRIVDWRTANGSFRSVDQLREVTGIGEAKYNDLKAKVAV